MYTRKRKEASKKLPNSLPVRRIYPLRQFPLYFTSVFHLVMPAQLNLHSLMGRRILKFRGSQSGDAKQPLKLRRGPNG